MKTGVIHSRELARNSNRADASFHLSDAISVKRQIARSPYPRIPIDKVASRIFYGTRAKRIYVQSREHGIPFLSSSDILQADLENVNLASRKYTQQIDTLLLQEGWILISRSGTVGKVAWATKRHAQKLASEHVIRLVPNDMLRGGLVYAYLSTSYGYAMLTQGTFGAVIQHIEPQHVASIPIPQFPQAFQDHIDSLIRQSATLREQAQTALDEAVKQIEDLFPTLSVSNNGAVNSKTVFSSLGKRFEASFHQSLGSEYDTYIKEHFTWKPLSEMARVSRPDLFKRYYVDNGLMFLGGKDIFLSIPKSEKFVSKKKTPDIPSLVIYENEILMPRSGTIGDVAIATSQHAQKLASEDVIRISADNILRTGYLYAFLSSLIGKALIQRYIFGSVIQHVEPHLLNHIPIPIIAEEKMKRISSLAMGNKEKLGKAGDLETEAISLVEQEISSWQ